MTTIGDRITAFLAITWVFNNRPSQAKRLRKQANQCPNVWRM